MLRFAIRRDTPGNLGNYNKHAQCDPRNKRREHVGKVFMWKQHNMSGIDVFLAVALCGIAIVLIAFSPFHHSDTRGVATVWCAWCIAIVLLTFLAYQLHIRFTQNGPSQSKATSEQSDGGQNALNAATAQQVDGTYANASVGKESEYESGGRLWHNIINLVFAGVVAAATAMLAYFGYSQLESIKGQQMLMKEQNLAIKRQGEVAQETIALTKRAQRPCILPIPPEDNDLKPGETFRAKITIKNFGQSVAYVWQGGACATIIDASTSIQNLRNIAGGCSDGTFTRIIPPGGTDVLEDVNDGMKVPDSPDKQGDIYIVGSVGFKDAADDTAMMLFCYRYDPGKKTFYRWINTNSLEYQSDKKK